MSGPSKIIIGVLLALAAAGVGMWEYRGYARERDALVTRIALYKQDIDKRERELEGSARVKRTLRKFADASLGVDEATVSASLRTALNEIVAHYGLIEPTVTSNKATAVRNPAVEVHPTELADRKRKDLRAPDFYTIAATVSGKGTLEQAVRTLATLELQPWVHRIDGFNLKPIGKEHDRVELTVMLTTAFLPEKELRSRTVGPEPHAWRPVEEWEFAAWRGIVAKNIFKEPPRAPQVAGRDPGSEPGAPTPPAPPSAASYSDWVVSGIARGRDGVELMLVNEKTKEWKTISVGGRVMDAKFIDGSGEVAKIQIGQEMFEVRSGQRLSERKPVSQ